MLPWVLGMQVQNCFTEPGLSHTTLWCHDTSLLLRDCIICVEGKLMVFDASCIQGSKNVVVVRVLISHHWGSGVIPARYHLQIEFVVGSCLAWKVFPRFSTEVTVVFCLLPEITNWPNCSSNHSQHNGKLVMIRCNVSEVFTSSIYCNNTQKVWMTSLAGSKCSMLQLNHNQHHKINLTREEKVFDRGWTEGWAFFNQTA